MNKPKTYKAKPRVTQAIQYDGKNIDAVKAFAGRELFEQSGQYLIGALHGLIELEVGNWVYVIQVHDDGQESFDCLPDDDFRDLFIVK